MMFIRQTAVPSLKFYKPLKSRAKKVISNGNAIVLYWAKSTFSMRLSNFRFEKNRHCEVFTTL